MCRDDVAIILVDRFYSYLSFMIPLEEDSKKKIEIFDRAIKKIKTMKGFTRFCNWMIGRSEKELNNNCWIIKDTGHILGSKYTSTAKYLYIKNIDTETTVPLSVTRCDNDNVSNQYETDLMMIPDSWRKFVGKDISWD